MILLPHELESSAWKKLKEYLDAQLAERREFNDGVSLTDVETATVRGEIKQIKKLLRIGVAEKSATVGERK